jgi:DNA helicase-2/ATP-dependent DNA helicase PcrA
MRLLAGARWRIGPADLMALRDWSSHLARRRGRPGSTDDDGDDAAGDDAVIEGDITDAASLVEALDWLPRDGWTSVHGRRLSPEARGRLQRLSDELRQLRTFMGDDLTTLLGEVERAMLLDIEVAARPGSASTRRAAILTRSRTPPQDSCTPPTGSTSWRSSPGWKRRRLRKTASMPRRRR